MTSELQRVVVRLSDVAAAPMARRLDLSNIEGIVLFVKDLDRPAVLWISELTLHR